MNASRFNRHALAAAVVLALATGAAQAQLSTATVKGQIAGTGVAPGTAVTAVNRGNGNVFRTAVLNDGSYVLTGLAPGDYEIRVAAPGGGTATSQQLTLRVGETATVDLAVGAAPAAVGTAAQQITIVGSAERRDVKTSEVGTNVSRRLIEKLPQQTHNFLSSADLAPGVAYTSDNAGYTRIQSGAQNFDSVNVYIDGVGQKNNILRGGVTGQDSSRGNPFPQSAIAEYKVLTQNYKAEFDQVSSVAITAITRSGTNDFHGELYGDRTGTNWRAKDKFEKAKQDAGVPLPPSHKYEYGAAVGGPILRDRVHFFVAYDGKKIEDSRQVVAQELNRFPNLNVGILPTLVARTGTTVDSFKEDLVFGKVDAQLAEDHRLSASFKIRRESDRVPESRTVSLPGNDKDRKNDESRADLLYEFTRGAFFNEARAGYENATWNPKSSATSPFIQYKVSTALPPKWDQASDVLWDGGSPDNQRRQQKAWSLGDDLTWTGLPQHVFKTGAKVKRIEYDLSGTPRSVPVVQVTIDRTTGLPYFDGTRCTGTNPVDSGVEQMTTECRLQRPLSPAVADFKNNQWGGYFQDDWAVTKKLELNLGVRYEYESNMLNNHYVTPADRVAVLFAPDVPRYGITPPAGQTYAQSLAKGGVDINDYISNGDSRKPYKKAFAPRVGASYDIFGDRNTVVFGGYGRSYDRTIANNAQDELQHNQQAGGEIWLINNKFKMPYADQFSAGLRQGVGQWNAELTLSTVRTHNQFLWSLGNRDANGGYATQSPIDPLWGGPNGYGSLILGDFAGRTRTDSVFVKIEKPYTQASGWSFNLAYTYSDAKTTNREWNNDIFDFTYGKPGQGGYKPSTLVEKHRVVVAALADNVLPWGFTVSAKGIFGSGLPRRFTDCHTGFSNCIAVEGNAPWFRQIDLSLANELRFWSQVFTVRADLLNAFNTKNYGGYDDFVGGPSTPPRNYLGGDNQNLGSPNAIRGDTRTFRLAVGYRF